MPDPSDGKAATFEHADLPELLARADVAGLAAFAESVLPALGKVEVVHGRTGLLTLPMRGMMQGADFHPGEVLVAEVQIRAGGAEGCGRSVGRDLERAMAMAVVDAEAQAAFETDGLSEIKAMCVDMTMF